MRILSLLFPAILLSTQLMAATTDKASAKAQAAPSTADQQLLLNSLQSAMSNTVTLNIDPKLRMGDLIEAFTILRSEKGAAKVYLMLIDGEKINQIIDLQPMTNQTLMLVRYSTNQGNQLKIIGIEEVDGISALP